MMMNQNKDGNKFPENKKWVTSMVDGVNFQLNHTTIDNKIDNNNFIKRFIEFFINFMKKMK